MGVIRIELEVDDLISRLQLIEEEKDDVVLARTKTVEKKNEKAQAEDRAGSLEECCQS
jgi:hypothetical protein